MSEKIPATVITGFLGAGKTSMIRHLVENNGGRRFAFIINEFGDLGVDRELLTGCGIEGCSDEDVIELANGCICCTVADDFLPTIEAILARPDKPDHIIIETSGLALPKPLVKAFAWPEVRTRTTVDGVIAVIDAAAVSEGRFADDHEAVQGQREADESLDHESPLEELFEEQLQCADMVVLNKTDLLDETGLAKVRETVAPYLRGGVKTVASAHGQLGADVLLGLGAAAEDDLESRPSHHDDGHEHDHDDFDSFVLPLASVEDVDALEERIVAAVREHDILRVKGFLDIPGKPMRQVIQGVGPRIQRYFDRDWKGGETRESRLVVIGHHGLDRDAIAAAIAG
ncbi:MAG: cobalamin biosynthesis protein CobW [Nisaea sp.]|uniref:cobalamin biosynthesis protein CobW n=1 Tax=Nisaea sp. TaxID=2024842 RepID=UPI001B06BFB3|nr:cobalamin biosynthesis protein CobW [Nisaea sp.]MBO6562244.1 cobalamin biosynthesis protein CobW [Nisaea sp.]